MDRVGEARFKNGYSNNVVSIIQFSFVWINIFTDICFFSPQIIVTCFSHLAKNKLVGSVR